MILEGFEIENWSCIKKVAVSGLPPTGVIVLHGPNRRGKSSIVQALRSCLMDYASSSQALKSWYPRGTGEKPIVSVSFGSNGASYRIKKHFGSSKSELATKTTAGVWKVETTSAADAHDKTCVLTGGSDSAKGLNQILWLTQAEFRLPEAKKFDANVQAQLRGILGVLQTSLDDQFLKSVKERWSVWFSGQRKADKQQEIKKSCKLFEAQGKLANERNELEETEVKFREIEALLRQASNLELAQRDLNHQLAKQTAAIHLLREEHQRSHGRIEARRHAESLLASAENELLAAQEEQSNHVAAVARVQEHERLVDPAKAKVDDIQARAQRIVDRRVGQRKRLEAMREERRKLRNQADRVGAAIQGMQDRQTLATAEKQFADAEAIGDEIETIQKQLAAHPAPEKKILETLQKSRQLLSELQAERDAASITLSIVRESDTLEAHLSVDGEQVREFTSAPLHVRRNAELQIHGWGRIELQRGSNAVDLDQIEDSLKKCRKEIAETSAPFGVSATDSEGYDTLLGRSAERELRTKELDQKRKQFKALAPKGIEPLQARVSELRTKINAMVADSEGLSTQPAELEALATSLKTQLDVKDREIDAVEASDKLAETELATVRQEEIKASVDLATCSATAKSSRDELARLRAEAEVASRVISAATALEAARSQLQETELTSAERTVSERVIAAEEAVGAIDKQSIEVAEKYNRIKGRLEGSEGLHAQRAAMASRVEELERFVARETLEKDAVDRLYGLFEECRDKQLGSLMTPIHDRVMNWLRVLDIGDYKEMRFNDAFLPDKLMTRDGTGEFSITEESTGAQEQIGMLVRLGLGSVLTSASDPAVAILDDPLTHCDIGRLNRMRVILRRIAEGDSTLTPAAGPMQIVILTCHPEWFRDDKATVIDLEDAAIMARYSN